MKDLGDDFTREMASGELCDMLGGKFNPNTNTCRFLDEHENFDRSVVEPKYALYYIAQLLIGTFLTFFGVFFGVTLVPPLLVY